MSAFRWRTKFRFWRKSDWAFVAAGGGLVRMVEVDNSAIVKELLSPADIDVLDFFPSRATKPA